MAHWLSDARFAMEPPGLEMQLQHGLSMSSSNNSLEALSAAEETATPSVKAPSSYVVRNTFIELCESDGEEEEESDPVDQARGRLMSTVGAMVTFNSKKRRAHGHMRCSSDPSSGSFAGCRMFNSDEADGDTSSNLRYTRTESSASSNCESMVADGSVVEDVDPDDGMRAQRPHSYMPSFIRSEPDRFTLTGHGSQFQDVPFQYDSEYDRSGLCHTASWPNAGISFHGSPAYVPVPMPLTTRLSGCQQPFGLTPPVAQQQQHHRQQQLRQVQQQHKPDLLTGNCLTQPALDHVEFPASLPAGFAATQPVHFPMDGSTHVGISLDVAHQPGDLRSSFGLTSPGMLSKAFAATPGTPCAQPGMHAIAVSTHGVNGAVGANSTSGAGDRTICEGTVDQSSTLRAGRDDWEEELGYSGVGASQWSTSVHTAHSTAAMATVAAHLSHGFDPHRWNLDPEPERPPTDSALRGDKCSGWEAQLPQARLEGSARKQSNARPSWSQDAARDTSSASAADPATSETCRPEVVMGETPLCGRFLRGTCRAGRDCRFLHGAAANVGTSGGKAPHRPPANRCRASARCENALMRPVLRDEEDSQATLAQGQVAAHSDMSTAAGSTATSRVSSPIGADSLTDCYFVWCDSRAFRESSHKMKADLEKAVGVSVKTHKAADKALRPLKKRGPMPRQSFYMFLSSWSCAKTLLDYLQEAPPSVQAQVIVLCDRCRGADLVAVERLVAHSNGMAQIARTWEEGVAAFAAVAAALAQSRTACVVGGGATGSAFDEDYVKQQRNHG